MRMGYNTKEPEPVGSDSHLCPACPYCGSKSTELISLFGQQLLTVQYYCFSCHTPFERIKDDDVLEGFATRKEGQL